MGHSTQQRGCRPDYFALFLDLLVGAFASKCEADYVGYFCSNSSKQQAKVPAPPSANLVLHTEPPVPGVLLLRNTKKESARDTTIAKELVPIHLTNFSVVHSPSIFARISNLFNCDPFGPRANSLAALSASRAGTPIDKSLMPSGGASRKWRGRVGFSCSGAKEVQM